MIIDPKLEIVSDPWNTKVDPRRYYYDVIGQILQFFLKICMTSSVTSQIDWQILRYHISQNNNVQGYQNARSQASQSN